MRRFPGSWVRDRAMVRILLVFLLVGASAGFGLHWLLAYVLHFLLNPVWISWVGILVMLALLVSLHLAWCSLDRGSIAKWLKGADSERNIGQAIERAIAAPGCSVAHTVTGLTGSGDIDHLVATPAALWVVETKTSRVPRKEFPRVLHGLARKVKVVREWAPPGTAVRGCLALDNPESARRRRYEAAGETIAVHGAPSLAKALGAEASGPPAVPFGLAERVWKLADPDE